MEGIAAAVASAPAGTVVTSEAVVGEKRQREDNPQYEKCCMHYQKDTLKASVIEKDVKLQGLLSMHAQVKPEPMWRLLCSHGYHTFRTDITDYCYRQQKKMKATLRCG